MVVGIRQVERALGSNRKHPSPSEVANAAVARKSIVTVRKILLSEPFSEENITVKCSGNGLSPMQYWERIGKIAERVFEEDDLIVL
jgi:sialic acid synthase SpsE